MVGSSSDHVLNLPWYWRGGGALLVLRWQIDEAAADVGAALPDLQLRHLRIPACLPGQSARLQMGRGQFLWLSGILAQLLDIWKLTGLPMLTIVVRINHVQGDGDGEASELALSVYSCSSDVCAARHLSSGCQ
jgi:hypothetical protein